MPKLDAPEPPEPLSREAYGQLLAQAREKAGWSKTQASELVGVGRVDLTRFETGRRLPSWPTLHRLILALGLDPASLFPGACAAGNEPKSKRSAKLPR